MLFGIQGAIYKYKKPEEMKALGRDGNSENVLNSYCSSHLRVGRYVMRSRAIVSKAEINTKKMVH
jgi:hypothetical protein